MAKLYINSDTLIKPKTNEDTGFIAEAINIKYGNKSLAAVIEELWAAIGSQPEPQLVFQDGNASISPDVIINNSTVNAITRDFKLEHFPEECKWIVNGQILNNNSCNISPSQSFNIQFDYLQDDVIKDGVVSELWYKTNGTTRINQVNSNSNAFQPNMNSNQNMGINDMLNKNLNPTNSTQNMGVNGNMNNQATPGTQNMGISDILNNLKK